MNKTKKWKRTIKNMMLYGGLEKEQFHSIPFFIEKVAMQIQIGHE